MNANTDNPNEQQEARSFRYVRRLRGFYLHLAKYAIVCIFLWIMNLFVMPQQDWALWVIGGWGIGILMHAIRVFMPNCALEPEWERRQVEKRLGRPL